MLNRHLKHFIIVNRTGYFIKNISNVNVLQQMLEISSILTHGGIFKTKDVVQSILAAMKSLVSTMETAGEGGAWGMALLANYVLYK